MQNESILSIIVVYYCNLWYPVISVRKWNVCYFFLIFCYKMKCLGILRIYLPLFFSYVYYSCHTSWLKYTGTIWTTLYRVRRENLYTPIVYIVWRLFIQFLYSDRTLGGTIGVSPKWLYNRGYLWPLYRPLQRLKLTKYKNSRFWSKMISKYGKMAS